MQKNSVLRGAVVLGLLASASAHATWTQPSNVNTGSSLFVTVFDPITQESYTTDLGGFYTDFMSLTTVSSTPNAIIPGAYTPRSYQLDMSLFSNNNQADLLFNVYAGDASGGNGLKGIVVTATTFPENLINDEMNGSLTQASQLMLAASQNCPSSNGCALSYGGELLWGSTINGAVDEGTAAPFDTPIAFYSVTGANTPGSTALASVLRIDDGNGWVWNLDGDGTLTFSAEAAPVPLPAAVWLLLSGLAGVGALGRRSGQKA